MNSSADHGPRVRLRRLPPPSFLIPLAARVLLIWILLRGVASAADSQLRSAGLDPLAGSGLTLRARVVVVTIVLFVTLVFSRRRRELIFLQNLGVSPRTWLLLAAVPPLVGELVITVMG